MRDLLTFLENSGIRPAIRFTLAKGSGSLYSAFSKIMPDPDIPPIRIQRPNEEKKQAVMEEFATEMRLIRAAKEAAKTGLHEALPVITETLTHHWSTGGGRRMRQIVWSIWNDSTLISLWDVLSGLDYKLGRAAAKLIEAKLAGALESDEILRRVLEDSGEFARYDEAVADTPEGEEVIYPPLPVSAERLRELADAAFAKELRVEAQQRAHLEEATTLS